MKSDTVARNEIYTRQFAILMFILTFTFKVSRLPPLVAEYAKSSGSLLVFLYMTLEVVMFFIVYRFVAENGAEKLSGNRIYKTLAAVLAANFLFKLILMYSGTILFTMELLFENISPYEIILTLIIPVAYAAYKGINSIARTAEICIWIIASVLTINLVFLNAQLDFSNNLPLLNGSFGELLTDGDKFFFWFGDFTPLLFVKLKQSKRNPVGLSLFISFIAVIFAIVIMFAMYGEVAEYISNFIVRIAGYNQFASKLGRLDWTGMIAWLIMALLFLAVYLWAFAEAGKAVVGNKKLPFFTGIIALLAVELIVYDSGEVVRFALKDIRWLAVVSNYIVPSLLLILLVYQKRKSAKEERLKEGQIEQGA